MIETVLHPHPAAGSAGISRLSVRLDRRGSTLRMHYAVEGEVDRIAWPSPAEAGRADGLWRRTCFEAFVQTEDGYVEYNLSPSGQWASYRFDGYREGMRRAEETASIDGMERSARRVDLQARINPPPDAWRLGLSAVIEAADGAITYWALAHPSAKPDFHHPDSFVLDLP